LTIGSTSRFKDHIYNFHKSVFNEEYLKEILLLVGFRDVRKWKPEEVELHSFEDWSNRPIRRGIKEYPISLNIEAVK